MSEPSVSSLTIYQLRVVRCGVSPLVWRRLLVVNETSLGELHQILQNAFDWSGEHLHRFFAFALLPFYLLKQQRSGRNFTDAFGISSGLASDKDEAKHSSKIIQAQLP